MSKKIKRSYFKTDKEYVDALCMESIRLRYLAQARQMASSYNETAAILYKADSLKARADRYSARKKDLKAQGLKSTSQANRLAVRAAERAIIERGAGMDGTPNLISVTLYVDVFAPHKKYPMSKSILVKKRDNEDDKGHIAVFKNIANELPAWPKAGMGYVNLSVNRAMELL